MTYSRHTLSVVGAREHNLRDVSVDLPKGKLICFTGVSGSGKSSLAFDTIYAEGQRRYIESLSSYARQFMGELPKPDVDQINGLAPAIAIQQKSAGWNPRSTVGTITQIHDYLRVLFARAGLPHCPQCGAAIAAQTREQMAAQLLEQAEGRRALLLAPKVRGQKGEYKDLFADLLKQGFIRARVDGEVIELSSPPPLDRQRRHDVDVVIDRIVVKASARARLAEALELALQQGNGMAIVAPLESGDAASSGPDDSAVAEKTPKSRDILLSSAYACTACNLSFEPPTPQMFSFNSPQGMCGACEGLGTRYDFSPELIIPDSSLTFYDPCVKPFRTAPGRWKAHFYEGVAKRFGFDLDQPWRDLSAKARRTLLYGAGDEHITYEWRGRKGVWKHGGPFAGIIAELQERYRTASSEMVRRWYEQYMRQTTCGECGGARLKPQALAVRLQRLGAGEDDPRGVNIQRVCNLSIRSAAQLFSELELSASQRLIAEEPLKEIRARLQFLLDVGLDYLTLDRAAPTLSGGESQRVRLASQIGSGLVGVLYILDEPSIGLHPRDNRRLLSSLQRLRDMGNTVLVVEHDRDTMEAADRIVDFGPGPGTRGGEVVACGSVAEVAAAERSVTGAYLAGRRRIEIPATRRPVPPPPTGARVDAQSSAATDKPRSGRTATPSKRRKR